jgi:DNA uptake protein ComE-like DNA-binding protein
MKNWMRDFFVFSNREHKGSIGLLVLLAVFLLLPQILLHLPTPEQGEQPAVLDEAFENTSPQTKELNTQPPFKFNPNTVSKQDLLRLGLSEKTASLLINYRSKGGVFRTAADFKKIYTLPAATYVRLEPYLTFGVAENEQPTTAESEAYDTLHYQKFPFDPNTLSVDSLKMLGLMKNEINHLVNIRNKGVKFNKKEQFRVSSWRPHKLIELQAFVTLPSIVAATPQIVRSNSDTIRSSAPKPNKEPCDINAATHEQLMGVNGIGNYYAKTILEKRALLGSFVQLTQLGDFMPDSLYKKILPQITLVSKPVKKIKINEIDLPTLQQFPGLKYKASLIINYRNHHGNFKTILDLWKVEGIRKDVLDKLTPYLDFEN